MTFQQFMAQVDAIIASRCEGFTSDDLSDWDSVCTRDMFDDGCTPDDVANEIIAGDDVASCMDTGARPTGILRAMIADNATERQAAVDEAVLLAMVQATIFCPLTRTCLDISDAVGVEVTLASGREVTRGPWSLRGMVKKFGGKPTSQCAALVSLYPIGGTLDGEQTTSVRLMGGATLHRLNSLIVDDGGGGYYFRLAPEPSENGGEK